MPSRWPTWPGARSEPPRPHADAGHSRVPSLSDLGSGSRITASRYADLHEARLFGGLRLRSPGGKRLAQRTRATLDTAGPTFVAFLLGVIVIVGGLIYFPMLILGPIGERVVG